VRTLLALDPGLRYPAVAVFKNGVLVHASRVKVPGTSHKLAMGPRCMNVARLVNVHVSPYCPVDELVIEWPRCYNRMKGDPADLFPLAGIGLALAGMLGIAPDAPTAPEWIGNIPKNAGPGDPWSSARGQRIKSRLSQEELSCIIVSHDAIDAVGLGLWKLGRLELRKSFIGATQ
jgi:hypothetical protein